MSRAFVKEDRPEPDEDPAERPLSPHPNYVTPRGLELLRGAEERLVAELAGYGGAQADPARRRRKRELERDLRYWRARLEAAIPVDPAGQPKDQARFGATVSLRGADGAARTLRIVGEDEAEHGGLEGVELLPWPAPFANALLGLKAGDPLDWDGARWTVAEIRYGL